MGSSENMAGSIVWVRRRNGSWWPGKILGPNELSASHLMSPRSGTPVKLLGREDASVDWYNLEKSKRVKAFRCGEFDDCIERAEASLGLPAKKREKYARREDAILHALELEKQYLMKRHGKLALTNFMRENSSDTGRRVSATSSVALENGNGKYRNHELYQLDEKIDVSSMTERNNAPLHEHKPQDRTYPNLQGHNTDESHQMKGLQDFGLRTIPVNRMIHTADFDDSSRMQIDGHLCVVPTNDPCFESSSDSDPWKSISKGKRSLEAVEGFAEMSLLQRQADYSLQHDLDFISMYEKREDGEGGCHSGYLPAESPRVFDSHCVPREQVEMPTSRLDVANCHNGTFAEAATSGSSEETESDSSETHSLEPYVEAGMVLSDTETRVKAQARTPDSSGTRGGDESTRNDESHDDRSQFYLPEPNSSGFGVSKWLLKRKRNARNSPKRPMNRFGRRAYLEERGRSLNHENDYSENGVDFIVGDFGPSTPAFVKTRFLPSQAAAKGPNLGRQNIIDSGELAWGRPSRGYCEKRGKCFNPAFVGRNGHDLLIDVDLKVQANHQGEKVPWVSLMSRLNGKAIIGHPIQIEALEDGSTDILVSLSDLKYDTDKERTLPSWRTGNFWHLSSQLEVNENAENQFFHQSGKVRSKAPNSFQSSSVKKTHTHHILSQPHRHPIQGMKKKMNPSSNHKTKTLSSFGFDQHSKKRRREKNPNYFMDSGLPAVACIPVKLVFSRLLEATGRAPSGPAKRGFQ